MKFRKAVLKVGKYRSPDGEVEVTTERLRHWANEFQRLKDAKQVVPIDWDHGNSESDLKPVTLDGYRRRRSAKNTVGKLADFRVTGDQAELLLDVPDEHAAEKAKSNLVYVSPVIFPSWKDGAGNEYRDCITHVDFVNHPVDHSQGPFQPADAIACAIRMGLSGPYTRDSGMPIRMGEDDPAIGFFNRGGKTFPITVDEQDIPEHGNKAKGTRKRGKAARSKRKKKKMGLTRMMSEDYPMDDAGSNGKESESDVMPESPPMLEEDNSDVLDSVLDLLEQHFQVVLPEDTDDDNLMERLHSALLTAGAHRNGDNGDGNGDPNQSDGGNTMVADPGAAGAAMLSLRDKSAIAWAESKHREEVTNRLRSLLEDGRCQPAEYKARAGLTESIKLSLDGNGKLELSDLEKWIESREAVPKGTFWDATQRTRLSATPASVPHGLLGDHMDDQEAKDIAAWALGHKKK